MITTEDLQRFNQAVTDARNAVPFDQERYDTAHAAYIEIIYKWAQEGKEIAEAARNAKLNNK